jgi:hypothetical protein
MSGSNGGRTANGVERMFCARNTRPHRPKGAWICFAALACIIAAGSIVLAAKLPKGYFDEKRSRELLDKTVTIRLDADLSQLTAGEREAMAFLLEAGEIIQEVYETSRHRDARSAYEDLAALDAKLGHPETTRNLIALYRLAQGPVVRNLDNKAVPFLPVELAPPGRNVYPWEANKKEVDAFIDAHPEEKPSILHGRTVVRRSAPEEIRGDLTTLSEHPVLDLLHPGLRGRLESLLEDADREFYAIPYSVAYAPYLMRVYDLLCRAAAAVEADDEEFSRYLRHRSVDLLRDDYEAGDAAWVTGRFGNLNAQIGSYETYDDALYGVKTFFSLSVLVKDPMMSSTVNTVKNWLQEMEDLLPYEPHKKVKTDISIGAYNVVADFGQARGTNTATILPNEPYITRKYGRTILLRNNILADPDIFEARKSAFEAAVSGEFHTDYDARGDFFRTLWHEIGHYLGPDATKDGASLDDALQESSSVLEELKGDLVALYVCKNLRKRGYYNQPRLRSVQTAGIRRVLQKNEPTKGQVYQTMQLMQLNYFLEKGLLVYDRRANKLSIHYDRYHETVESMLRETLALQQAGDKDAADEFISKYSSWKKEPHERLAKAMKAAENHRYVGVRYAALGE